MSHIANKLIDCIKNLSNHAVNRLLDIALEMLDVETDAVDRCPYCGGHYIVQYGHKRVKQCFLCRNCGRTFVTITHTIMSMSPYPASVWKDVITDTIRDYAIDFTAARLGLSHQ